MWGTEPALADRMRATERGHSHASVGSGGRTLQCLLIILSSYFINLKTGFLVDLQSHLHLRGRRQSPDAAGLSGPAAMVSGFEMLRTVTCHTL